jgi:aspartate-semialdehyde dehydrogenase
MSEKLPVTVLAATGSVGQRFIQLLDNHPWFEVVSLTGSDRSIGQKFGSACHWILPEPMPAWAAEMTVVPTTPDAANAGIAFSALPAGIAKDSEPQFAQAGVKVFSNASAFRNEPDVPILLPEVNAAHAHLVTAQRVNRGWPGYIITNSNCTSTGMTVALKAMQDAFGLSVVFAVSMQALSGAGYPGVASMDIIDNVVPYVGGEEEKVEWEPRKMLGKLVDGEIEPADFAISAHTNRVAVSDGHTVCLSIELSHRVDIRRVAQAFRDYQAPKESADLPSAPSPVIHLRSEADRPQPRLDRMTGKGMATVVGRLRPDPVFDIRMVVLSHNTIRGAAGGSLYNAELLVKLGL